MKITDKTKNTKKLRLQIYKNALEYLSKEENSDFLKKAISDSNDIEYRCKFCPSTNDFDAYPELINMGLNEAYIIVRMADNYRRKYLIDDLTYIITKLEDSSK